MTIQTQNHFHLFTAACAKGTWNGVVASILMEDTTEEFREAFDDNPRWETVLEHGIEDRVIEEVICDCCENGVKEIRLHQGI